MVSTYTHGMKHVFNKLLQSSKTNYITNNFKENKPLFNSSLLANSIYMYMYIIALQLLMLLLSSFVFLHIYSM